MHLSVEQDGRQRTVQLVESPFVIGREPGCQLQLDDPKVSRRHADLCVLDDGRVQLRDLGSANGTFVDGVRLDGRRALSGGEQLRFGATTARLQGALERQTAAGLVETVPPPGETVVSPKPSRVRAAEPPEQARRPSLVQRVAPASRSAIERLQLQRGLRRATALAVAAVAVTGLVLALALTGALSRDGVRAGDEAFSPAKVVDQVRSSTVFVLTSHGERGVSSGSGWALDAAAGLIVTNSHVVAPGTQFEVNLERGRPRRARLVAVAPCEDLAVLRVDPPPGLRAIRLGSQATLRQGAPVVAVGFPSGVAEGDRLVATSGVVSVVRTSVAPLANIVRTDAAINPGSSGGPLVAADATLVGVNSLGATRAQNENYAIGVDRVKEVTAKLRTGDSLAWTGMGLDEATTFDGRPGIFIGSVMPGSAAARAGVPSPGYLTAVNGRQMSGGLAGYCDAVGREPLEPADMTVVPLLRLQRGGQGAITSAQFGPARRLSVGFE